MDDKTPNVPFIIALIPILFVIISLSLNAIFWEYDVLNGPSQIVLLTAGVLTLFLAKIYQTDVSTVLSFIIKNIKEVGTAIFILVLVGALSASWMLSGVIPTLIYYGIQILNIHFFLPGCLIICCLISLATGSSWTTSATIGIALIGMSKIIHIPIEITAGAILSGAYFGDKISPLSDTTNLAAGITQTPLFVHIKYMLYTTIPSILLSLLLFIGINIFGVAPSPNAIDTENTTSLITSHFNTSNYLLLVLVFTLLLAAFKIKAYLVLLGGIFLGIIFYLFFQASEPIFQELITVLRVLIGTDSVQTQNPFLDELFFTKGIIGMISTILLILTAMIFGGILEATGFLKSITFYLLSKIKSVFGLFLNTSISCLTLNLTASDQYISIVLPGKMFAKAFKEKQLASENLSRTLEDSGTVTSVLIPWNTCGAYHTSVLGLHSYHYAFYCFFNILSPIMTLLFAWFQIKIRKITLK